MALAIQDTQLTEFAERVYTEQKEVFVEDFAQYLKSRIESGLAQFENGQYMSLEESQDRINKEFFSKTT
jgi:ABC-type transporter MlaC component